MEYLQEKPVLQNYLKELYKDSNLANQGLSESQGSDSNPSDDNLETDLLE